MSDTALAPARSRRRILPLSLRLWGLLILLLACAAGYMLIRAEAPWSFLLPYRGAKLAALVLVGVALSVATVVFQTLTANRILTPSLMGFDALYIFVLTLMVHSVGATAYANIPVGLVFTINLGSMALLGLLLFAVLLRLARGDMVRLVLTGIVLGLLIRSITEFVQRLIDPNEFQTVQSLSVARFTQVDTGLLALSSLAIGVGLVLAWRLRLRLDVLALGDTAATGLGEPPAKLQRHAMLVICLLVASATALVGPMASQGAGPSSFFGLIVTAIAHVLTPTHRHSVLLPSAALIGGIILVGGQLMAERVFALATPLIVVIELIGGGVFLIVLLKRRAA